MRISLSKLEKMVKSVVKEYTRKTKGGKIIQVRQHEDSRSKKEEQSSPVRITDGPHKGKEGFANKKELRSGKVKVMFRGVNMSGAYIKPEWVDHKADKEGKGKEKKTTMSSGLASIVKEVAKHDSFETAYDAFKHRTGIPSEVANEFFGKFGDGGELSPEKAFRNLYEHATGGKSSNKKELASKVIEKTKKGFDFKGQSKVRASDVFANTEKQPAKEFRSKADKLIESGGFDQLPEIDVPVSKLIPTQRFIHATNLERVKDSTPDTNAYILKDGDDYYILDGHHRIAANIVNQESVVSAHVFDASAKKKSEVKKSLPFGIPHLLIKSRSLHGRMDFQGLDISVENRKGSIRQWYDPHNKENGTTRMKCPYGYIKMTKGSDGDHVDCYVGPHRDAKSAYIVHQMKAPEFKTYDEEKAMLGFNSTGEAKDAYLAHYNDKRFLGSMTTMPMEQFKDKVLATKDRPGKIRKATTGLYLLKK